MNTQSSIDNIRSLFSTQECDMPRISTPTEDLNFATLQAFEDKFNSNAMNVPSWTSQLGHLYLTIKDTEFTSANGGTAAIIPTDPPVIRPPTSPAVVAAIAASEDDPTGTVATTDPFAAQEAIRT